MHVINTSNHQICLVANCLEIRELLVSPQPSLFLGFNTEVGLADIHNVRTRNLRHKTPLFIYSFIITSSLWSLKHCTYLRTHMHHHSKRKCEFRWHHLPQNMILYRTKLTSNPTIPSVFNFWKSGNLEHYIDTVGPWWKNQTPRRMYRAHDQ